MKPSGFASRLIRKHTLELSVGKLIICGDDRYTTNVASAAHTTALLLVTLPYDKLDYVPSFSFVYMVDYFVCYFRYLFSKLIVSRCFLFTTFTLFAWLNTNLF
jgi:hypothetical protein